MDNTEKMVVVNEIADDVYSVISEAEHLVEDSWRFENLKGKLEDMFKSKYGVEKRRKLSEYSWEEIAYIAEKGNAESVFNIGDEKEIELYTGEKITAVILDFKHDNKADGSGKAGITFGIKDILDGWYEMNEDYTNDGGWVKSKMRNVYMQRYFKLLPNELREVIMPVIKETSIGGAESKITYCEDLLFLFNEAEVFGETDYSAKGEGKQYLYFKNSDNRIKHRNTSAYLWWLRSPYYGNSTFFCFVNYLGNCSNYSASGSSGVCFGFCV